jgi:MFS family permease
MAAERRPEETTRVNDTEGPARSGAPVGEASLFAEPDVLRLWLVGLVVFVVRWLETLAGALFVLEATGSAFLVAMLTMLRMLPMGLFGAFLGALVERVEQRTSLVLLVASQLVISVVLVVLAHSGTLAVWHLLVASFVGGIGWAADNPVRRLMIGQVAGPSRLGRAMSVDIGSNNASRMVGPALAGLMYALVGIEGTFALGALLQLIALVAAITLRHRSGTLPAGGEGILARVGEGFALARRDPRLRATLLVTVIFNVFGWPFTSLIPVVAREGLALSPEGTGLLASMDGLGSLLSALVLALLARPAHYARIYVWGTALYLAMQVVFALSPDPWLAGAALLVNGFGHAAFSAMQATLVYLSAPVELRSRVLGVLTLCIGLGPVGFLLIGGMAAWLGAGPACVASGLLGLLTLALTWPLWRAILAREDPPP